MSIKPLGYRVLLELDPVQKESKGGILLPEGRMDKARRTVATVRAIGPIAWRAVDEGTPWASVGEKVTFSAFDGKKVIDPDAPEKEYVLINDQDLQCAYTQEIGEFDAATVA